MKTLYLAVILILLSVIFSITQTSVFAQPDQQNSVGLSYQECQNKIGNEMQKVSESINKTKAISLALSSNEFQSKASGYRYTFTSIFTNMTSNQSSCDDVKLKDVLVEFSLLNPAGELVKYLDVGEDPTLTKVTLVEFVDAPQINNNIPPSPPAAKYPALNNILSVFHVTPSIVHPNEIDAAQIEVQNNGNFALYDVQVHFWNDTTLALHRPDKIDTLQPHETKIIRGALSTSNITSGTRDLFWQIIAKNETGTIMESILFQRPLTVEDISKSQEFNYCCRDLDSTSPLKQFKSGIAIKNIKCRDDLKLIIKKSNNSPVCVKPKSVLKLLLRGWATLSLKDFGYNPGRGPVTLQESSKNQNVTLTVDNSLRVCGALGLPCPLEPRFQAKQIDNGTYVVVLEINGKSYTVTLNDTATCVTPPVNGRPACFTEPEQIAVNQAAQIIPSCMSHIENQYASAGPRGDPLCPVVNFGASSKILNATGFYGIYSYAAYPNTLNFVLEPGHNGTMTYLISVSWIHNWGNTPEYPNEINITNDVVFMHDAGMNNHPGVDVSVNPKSEMIEKNGSASVTMTFSASKDALHGTYWVRLPPGICTGGEIIVLTITDCTK